MGIFRKRHQPTNPNDSDYYSNTGSSFNRRERDPWINVYATRVRTVDVQGNEFTHLIFHPEHASKGYAFTKDKADPSRHLMRQVIVPPEARRMHLFALHSSRGKKRDIQPSSAVRQYADKHLPEDTPVGPPPKRRRCDTPAY
jgi:hypothetical protein